MTSYSKSLLPLVLLVSTSLSAMAQNAPRYELRTLKSGLRVTAPAPAPTPAPAPAPAPTPSAQNVTLNPASVSFGNQEVGQASSASVLTLSNTDPVAVTVSSVSSSNAAEFVVDNSAAGTCGATVAPGSSCTVTVRFLPSSEGSKTSTLTVVTNAGTKTASLSGTGVVTPSDPQFANVVALLDGDSLPVTDRKGNTVSYTAGSGVTLVPGVFGNAFRVNADTTAAPAITSGEALSLTGDFTIELRYKLEAHNHYGRIMEGGTYGTGTNGWIFAIDNSGVVYFAATAPGVSGAPGLGFARSLLGTGASNTFKHVAITRQGNVLRAFVNGALVASNNSFNLPITATASRPIRFGAATASTGSVAVGAYDDVRITKGIARYTAAFTVPTEPSPAR